MPLTGKAKNQELFRLFTSGELYLTFRSIESKEYLGKIVSPMLSFEELFDQKRHIASLFQRLFPEKVLVNDDFILFGHGHASYYP